MGQTGNTWKWRNITVNRSSNGTSGRMDAPAGRDEQEVCNKKGKLGSELPRLWKTDTIPTVTNQVQKHSDPEAECGAGNTG